MLIGPNKKNNDFFVDYQSIEWIKNNPLVDDDNDDDTINEDIRSSVFIIKKKKKKIRLIFFRLFTQEKNSII